jgi:hypothetical protein
MLLLGRLFLSIFCCCAAGQVAVSIPAQTRHPSPSKPPTEASIAGTVINSETGAPLEGVHVRLTPGAESELSLVYGALSDAAGHFSIATLPPSDYSITLERRGFVMVRGKRGTFAANGSFELKPGEHVHDVTFRMTPRAILSGRVLDEYGDPVMNVFVAPIAAAPEKVIESWDLPLPTNDRGVFRLGVPPGKYYIVVGIFNLPDERSGEVRGVDTAESTYQTTYYPSATQFGAATAVEAKPGRETSGLEIRLAHTAALKVSGVIMGTQDCLSTPAVIAEPPDAAGSSPAVWTENAELHASAKFLWSRVAPGTYRVSANCAADGFALRSQIVELTVTDSNVENLSLELARGPDITDVTGKVEWSAPEPTAAERKGLAVGLLLEGNPNGDRAEVAADGTFRIEHVFPQHYRLQVQPLPINGFIKTVRVNGTPIPGRSLDFTNGAEGAKLEITLSANGGQVTGWVTEGSAGTRSDDGTVLLFGLG